mgnify:FL=1
MKKKKGFNLRNICGEHVIVAEGRENIDFSKIISMNESAAYLWESVGDKEFTVETLAHLLTETYEVDPHTATADAIEMATQWVEAGIAE